VDIFRPVENSGPPFEIGLGDNKWPATPDDFRPTAEKYIEAVVSLATQVVQALAMGLGVEDTIFTSRIGKAFWNLRILGYYPNPEGGVAGIGEHTGKQTHDP
jgi:isopenicillin N synthase-like dioxygenase